MLWNESKIFKILPVFDSYIEIPKIRRLNNIRLLKKFLFMTT